MSETQKVQAATGQQAPDKPSEIMSPHTPDASPCAAEPECVLPPAAEQEIAANLRRLYGEMLAEPIPERFAGLLAELAKSERTR